MAKRCPSCRTEVADDARVCPNCPWIFPEEEAEDLPPAAVATGWSPLPLVITALVAASIGIGWFFVVKVYREETEGPSQPAPAPAPAPAPVAPPPPPDSVPPRTTVSSTAKPPAKPIPDTKYDEPAAPPPTVTVIKEPPVKKSKPVKEWKIRGFVYDLMTLQPVPRCKVKLYDLDTNANFETSTDAGGRYRAILPPLPDRGYLMEISKSGYASSYLDPGAEGVRQKPEDDRQRLCKELASAVQQPSSLQPHGADPLVTDFYIAPDSCR